MLNNQELTIQTAQAILKIYEEGGLYDSGADGFIFKPMVGAFLLYHKEIKLITKVEVDEMWGDSIKVDDTVWTIDGLGYAGDVFMPCYIATTDQMHRYLHDNGYNWMKAHTYDGQKVVGYYLDVYKSGSGKEFRFETFDEYILALAEACVFVFGQQKGGE